MKKLFLIPLCMFMLAASCQKKQGKELVPAKWGILTYRENGVDKTSEFNSSHQGFYIFFDVKGNFMEAYHSSAAEVTINGTWTLEKNDTELMLVDNDPNSAHKIRTFQVVHLTADSLDIRDGMKEYDLRKL